MSTTPESEPYNNGKRNGTLRRVIDQRQNFSQISPAECYLTQLLSGRGYFCKYLFKMSKMTRPNCIYDDASIDVTVITVFHCERWSLERNNLEAKVGICTVLNSEENWNSIANCSEALPKSKKFDLDERSRMNVETPSKILLRNPEANMDIMGSNSQTDSTSK